MTRSPRAFMAGGLYAFALLAARFPAFGAPVQQPRDSLKDTVAVVQAMSLDVTGIDIKDLVRMVSRGYGLNVVVDKDVKGAVTLHLSSVPIIEGLRAIARSLDLDVIQEGAVYHLRNRETPQTSEIAVLPSGKLKVDVRDADVREFLEDLSKKSGVSIVFDDAVQGRVTGKLVNVPLDDGLKALLEGNGYKVANQKSIYRVTCDFDVSGAPAHRHAIGAANYPFYVNYANNMVSLDAHNADLGDVIRALASEAQVQIVTYGDVTGKINAQIEDVTFNEAMDVLLGGTHFAYVRRGKMILIGDRNASVPSGQELSVSEMIPLRHLKAEDVPPLLPASFQLANIKVVKEQNALLISGTGTDIAHVKDFLTTVDVPTPQVVIDVIIIEYTMDNNLNWGLEFGLDNTVTNSESFPSISFSREGDQATNMVQQVLGAPVAKYLGYLGDDFFIRLRALAAQNKAKVLAQPSITVLNGHKATINVGQTQYFKIVTEGSTAETMSFRFQPISFGININVTPWVAPSGQITTDVAPEISNSMGVNADGYPNIFTRSVSTTVRLNNNETLVLGGLIRREQDLTINKVPVLGDIPWLGNLFKTTIKEDIATNLSVYMTPHIIADELAVDINRKVDEFGDKDVNREMNRDMGIKSRAPVKETKRVAPAQQNKPQVKQAEQSSPLKSPAKPDSASAKGLPAAKTADSRPNDMIIDVPQKNKPQADKPQSGPPPRHGTTQDGGTTERPPYNDDDYYLNQGRNDQ